MNEKNPGTVAEPARIEFVVGISLQGPIVPQDYDVEDAVIQVSYPSHVVIGGLGPIALPLGASTQFVVSWLDKKGKAQKHLQSGGFERNLPIYRCLDLISRLLGAFKLVRIGHLDGMRIRTVGISDTLYYWSTINGVPAGDLNVGMRLEHHLPIHGLPSFDRSETTPLALPHVNADSFPIARRYVRCFELLEHGFYKETVIIAHAILDDLVQETIHRLLHSKGLDDENSRKLIVRTIKEARLQVYLGPLLKILAGETIDEIWADAQVAISWLNRLRNEIAHRGSSGDRESACKAIFVSMKTIAVLNSRKLIEAEFPKGMFRHARLSAAWTQNPEAWVPTGEAIEVDPFDPWSEPARGVVGV